MRKNKPNAIKLAFSGGRMLAIHSDELQRALRKLGTLSIKRASHVEPNGDKWEADMSPMGGPLLTGYNTRAAALRAERAWLNRNTLS